jgi:hypothetical protein
VTSLDSKPTKEIQMNRNPTANQFNQVTSIPRNPDGALTSFNFLNKTQRQKLKLLQNDAIKNCGLLTPYCTANRKKHLEGVSLSILDVHLTDDKVDGLIVRANAYVLNPNTCRTRNESKFFLATRNGSDIEVRELHSGICATSAKQTVGLGLLAGHYMKQPTQASSPVKGFSILLEVGQMFGNDCCPLQPAIPTQEIIKQAVRIWQVTGQCE